MKRTSRILRSVQTGILLLALGFYSCKQQPKDAPVEDTAEKTADTLTTAASPFQYSLAQWSVHNMIASGEMDPMDFAEKAKAWGFTGLEYVNHLYAKQLANYESPAALASELKKRSDSLGMTNLIMMVDLPPETGSLASPDDALRQTAVESHLPWLDATAALGCHSMRVNLFGTTDPEAWKTAAIDALTKLGAEAEKRGVNVIVENHGYLSSDASLLAEVITAVNRENVGTLPDFGNFCLKREGGQLWQAPCIEEYDMYKGVAELMPFAKGVSAKSYNFDADGQETKIDYTRMMQIVKDAGYTGYVGVEYEGTEAGEEEGIKATLNLLKKVTSNLK